MRSKQSFLPLALLLSLAGCFDDSGRGSSATAPEATIASTAAKLSTWADTAQLSLPNDANLATIGWQQRWDSVVNLVKYRSQARENLKAIAADWASRRPQVSGWREAATVASPLIPAYGTLRLVSFAVDGISQGGFVWIPKSAQNRTVPVVLFGHPDDQGIDLMYMYVLLSQLMDSTTASRVAIVAPAYRGEIASAGTDSVASDTSAASPWDRDVDDALAMLNGALNGYSRQLDASRICAVGYSRGAGVSLLAGLRDARIGSVFEIAGPTDFFAPSIQRLSLSLLAGQSADLPGLDVLNAQLLQPFAKRAISADSLRHALLQRSAARLALSGLLPVTTAVHGSADLTVSPDQSEALHAASVRAAYLPVAGMTHSSFLMSSASQQEQVRTALQGFLRTHLNLP